MILFWASDWAGLTHTQAVAFSIGAHRLKTHQLAMVVVQNAFADDGPGNAFVSSRPSFACMVCGLRDLRRAKAAHIAIARVEPALVFECHILLTVLAGFGSAIIDSAADAFRQCHGANIVDILPTTSCAVARRTAAVIPTSTTASSCSALAASPTVASAIAASATATNDFGAVLWKSRRLRATEEEQSDLHTKHCSDPRYCLTEENLHAK